MSFFPNLTGSPGSQPTAPTAPDATVAPPSAANATPTPAAGTSLADQATAAGLSPTDVTALQKQLFPSRNFTSDEMQLVFDTLEANKERQQSPLSGTVGRTGIFGDGGAPPKGAQGGYGTYGQALPGFAFPDTISASDFHSVLTEAESFANQMGWAAFPSPDEVMHMYQNGMAQDPRAASAYLYSQMPQALQQQKPWGQYGLDANTYQDKITQLTTFMQDLTGAGNIDPTLLHEALAGNWSTSDILSKLRSDPAYMDAHPWMKYGQTYTQWQQTQLTAGQSLTDTYEQLTGNRNIDPNLLNQAVQNRWSSSQFETALRKDSSLLAQYGYLDTKYGNYTAASWSAHKLQAKNQIIARFGQDGATDANYLADLGNPLVAMSSGGGGAVKQQNRQQADVGMSEVR